MATREHNDCFRFFQMPVAICFLLFVQLIILMVTY